VISKKAKAQNAGDKPSTGAEGLSRRSALGRLAAGGSAALALGGMASIASVSAQSEPFCGNFPCEPGGALSYPLRALPKRKPDNERRLFRLGAATIAVDAPVVTMTTLVTPLFGHLPPASGRRAHLHLALTETDVGLGVWSNAERYFQGAIDATLAHLHFEAVEASYRTMPTLAVIHGAAVMAPVGAVLLVGQAGAGKSTLAAALAARGFRYLADDVCPIDARGRLVPVPSSQCVKAGSWAVLDHDYPVLAQLAVRERLGHKVKYLPPVVSTPTDWSRPYSIAAVVFSRYGETSKSSMAPLSNAQKVAALATSGSLRGNVDAAALDQWIDAVPAYRLTYATSDEAAAMLATLG